MIGFCLLLDGTADMFSRCSWNWEGDASLKQGAMPIILLNGESIVNLMIEKGLGVERVPLYAYYERPGDFAETDEN